MKQIRQIKKNVEIEKAKNNDLLNNFHEIKISDFEEVIPL